MDSRYQIRPASHADVGAMNELTKRSILYWGYDPEILEWGGDDITVTSEWISDSPVYVLEDGGRLLGYYGFKGLPSEPSLDKMFVDADQIGKGHGKRLWRHALEVARAEGVTEFAIFADANAAGFYEAMGAVGDQTIETGRPDFILKHLRYQVSDDALPSAPHHPSTDPSSEA